MLFSCGICKELFVPEAVVSTTVCGHLYHVDCLEKWQKRSKYCPQCRSVMSQKPHRVYFDLEDRTGLPDDTDNEFLINQREELMETVRQRDRENGELKESCTRMENVIADLREELSSKEQSCEMSKAVIRDLKKRVVSLTEEKKEIVELREANEMLEAKLNTLKLVSEAIHSSGDRIHEQLKKTPLTHLALQQLITLTEVLKDELSRTNERHVDEVNFYKHKCKELSQKLEAKRGETYNKGTQTSTAPSGMMSKIRKYIDENTLMNKKTEDILTSPESGKEDDLKQKKPTAPIKIINNLEKKVLSSNGNTSDSSETEIIFNPYINKATRFMSSAGSSSTSIFRKDKFTSNTKTERYEPCYSWGKMRNPLATPTPREELQDVLLNKKKKKPAKNQSYPYARPSTCTKTMQDYYSSHGT